MIQKSTLLPFSWKLQSISAQSIGTNLIGFLYHEAKCIIANITRVVPSKLGLPQCQSLRSRIIIDPFGIIGCTGGESFLRDSKMSDLIRPDARSPCRPSCTWSPEFVWVPSQTSVEPLEGVMLIKGTFTTNANGICG
jgi:hypothetical protein